MSAILRAAAAAEALTGLALLLAPAQVVQLLLGADLQGAAPTVARVAGMALVGLGVACWPGRARLGMLAYSLGVAAVLGHAGWTGAATGMLLWPAVAVHGLLSILLARGVRG